MEAKKSGKPTPTPWAHRAGHGKHHAARWILSGEVYVAKTYGHEGEDAEANAQRIVTAVNASDEMVDCLRDAVRWIEMLKPSTGTQNMIARFRAAIASATGEARP